MVNNIEVSSRRPRLNPFVFPSDTTLRFMLLIVTGLGASLFIYHWIGLQTHFQELLAAASCELRQTPKLEQALSAQDGQAFQKAADAVRQCGIAYHRIETTYMIGGVVLVGVVALVIHWLFPLWKLWRGKLASLSAEDSPELMTYLAELCREAQLARPPSFVCNPFNQTITGLAFGRIGRYYVALSGGLVTLFSTDKARFRAIVLHELAHLRNADVTKTYFALACWWAFVMVALVPFAVISAVGFARNPDVLFTFDEAWRVLVMVALVFLILAATLRAREFYADVRAAIWENSAAPLLRVLNLLEMPKKRWQRVTQFHPDPRERGRTLNEPDRLFRMGLWEALGFGIAIGIAAPNVLALMSSFLDLQLQIAFSDLLDWQTLGAALILAPLIAVAAGLSTWRTTFAALVQGRVPLGIGRAGLCVGVGLILGTFLSLSIDNGPSVNPLFLFVLSLPWSLVVLVSLFLFLRWIATGTSAWLDVMISSRSPRLFYTVGLVIASAVLVVVLAQLFLFHSLATTIAPLLKTPFDLLIGFAVVIVVSILLLINTLLSPGVLVAFVCLWVFPLAAWFWRKQAKTPVGSHWAFLGASSQPIVLPRQDPFRLRFALVAGLVGGLVFCGLLLLIRISVHLSVPESIRGNYQFRIILSSFQIVLAALLQATAAGIVAGRVRRLGVLHGLFAAFVGGCVMTAGIIGTNLLFGGTAPIGFIWQTFCLVINGGALLALPITLIVSKIVDRTRKSHREVHEGRRQTMFCEHCGAQNPETASYCRVCGKRMEGKRENQAHQHVFQGTILFLAGPLAGRSFPIIAPVTTLGSDPRNTIVVPDPAVSPFHARLVLTGSGWAIELLTPQNTLMVNQTQTRQQLIRDQDVIRLGSATVFRCALKTGMPYYPQPLVSRPQQVRSGMRLSRRTVLIGGAALAGGLLLLLGGGKILSSRFSQPQPFQHVALGTHLVTYQGHDESVWSVAWSPDSTRIASGGSRYGATVEVWNALDGTTVYTQPYTLPSSIIATVESLAWSPDGTRIVIDETGNYEDVHAWDAADGGHDTKFELPSTLLIKHVSQVAWSPDCKRIAAACESTDLTTSNDHAGIVLVWDVASAKALTYYTTQSDVKSVAWSLDSQRIAAAIDNTVQVLSVGSWQPLSTYQGHSDLVWSVAWSPDGRRIASGSSDNTVQVWDATNANTLSTYRGHTKTVETVTWSPDSQRLASGSDDWTVQVWNAADARQFYVYKGHSDLVHQVAWSADGTRIASSSKDNTVQVWGAG